MKTLHLILAVACTIMLVWSLDQGNWVGVFFNTLGIVANYACWYLRPTP